MTMINQYQDKQYQRGTMSKFNNNKDKPYQRKTMTNTIYITNIFNLHVNSGRKCPKSFKKIPQSGICPAPCVLRKCTCTVVFA